MSAEQSSLKSKTGPLSGVLDIGNKTNDGQSIESLNGQGHLNLRAEDSDNIVVLTNDSGTYSDSGVYFSPNYAGMYTGGYSSAFETLSDPSGNTLSSYTGGASSVGDAVSSSPAESIRLLGLATLNTTENNQRMIYAGDPLTKYSSMLCSQNGELQTGVNNAVTLGGLNILARTNNTAYVTQFGFSDKLVNAFETIIDFTQPTADRLVTIQDKSGTLALLSDIPGSSPVFLINRSEDFSRIDQTTEGLVNQQLNVFEDYLVVNFTPTETDNYVISSNYIWSLDATTSNFMARLSVENVTDSVVNVYRQTQIKPSDTLGSGAVLNVLQGGAVIGNISTGTNQRFDAALTKAVNLVAGKEYNIAIQWAADQANTEAAIYEGDLTIERKTLSP